MRSGRRRAALRAPGGWAAARAADVFGGCGGGAALGGDRAEGGGLNPEVGRRWSERARSGAQAGSQRASPASPVMDLWGVRAGDAGAGRGAGWRGRAPSPPGLGLRRRSCLRRCPPGRPHAACPAPLPAPSPPGGVGRRTLPVPDEVCPARPGEHVLGETWVSRPPRPYCHRRASLSRGGRPPPPVPSAPREAALPLLRPVSEPCPCAGPARCAPAFFPAALLLVVLSSPALLVLRPQTLASNAWKP